MANKRLYWKAIGELELVQEQVPKPSTNEVLIKMRNVGICGSDLHFLHTGRLGPKIATEPFVLGHEGAGVVVDVGEQVTGLEIGDKVAIEAGIPCKTCEFCRSGRYNLCVQTDAIFQVVPPQWGMLSTFYIHDASMCHRLPDNLDCEHGALLEPLSVASYAVERSGMKHGDNILITGSGTIGLLTLMVARSAGANRIIVTDVSDVRLQKAEKLGSTATLNVSKMSNKDAAEKIRQLLTGASLPRAIECSGTDDALRTAIYAVDRGGVICVPGIGAGLTEFPVVEVTAKELDITGAFRYPLHYQRSIELISSGKIDPKAIVTSRMPFTDYLAVFEKATDEHEIKVMVEM